MRKALSCLVLACCLSSARAELVPLASNGAWVTVGDIVSPKKVCGVEGLANGGKLFLYGTSSSPGVLSLLLTKPSWHIPGLTVPIVMSFSKGATYNFVGIGQDQTIKTNIAPIDVKSFVHHFTADENATVTLPEGHESPWSFDLHGSTPAIMAIAQCIDAAQILLPPPFRPPQTPAASEVAAEPGATTSAHPSNPEPSPPAAEQPDTATHPQMPAPPPQLSASSGPEVRSDLGIRRPDPKQNPAVSASFEHSEDDFVAAIAQYHSQYDTAANDFQKGVVYRERASALGRVFSTGFTVKGWTGKVYKLSSNGDGFGVLEITLSKDTWLSTWNNSFSDTSDHTLIAPQSPVYAELGSLKEGDEVVFSGNFLPDDTSGLLKTTELTMDGKMTEPEFLFSFSDVRKR